MASRWSRNSLRYLVGGAVVAIYTEGLYRSGDLDLIPDDMGRTRLKEVLAQIGFHPSKSRYFKHPECSHLFLEFPRGPVEIGEQYPVVPAEIEVEGRTLRLLSPTDSVKDRLAGYIHWKVRANFEQALLICQRQQGRVDLDDVRNGASAKVECLPSRNSSAAWNNGESFGWRLRRLWKRLFYSGRRRPLELKARDAPTPFPKMKSPKRAKVMLWIVAFGLFVSGVTVWPAIPELKFAIHLFWGDAEPTGEVHRFTVQILESL